jgi:D-alanyl-D-alanine dipeptidase
LFAVACLSAGARSGKSGKEGRLPDGFVDITDVAPGVVVDARYAGSDNFMGPPVRGYGAARCVLTRPAARAVAAAQRELAASGLGLLLYDCYRPQRAVDDFVAWAREGGNYQRSAAQSRRAQARAVRARLHRAALRPQPGEHGGRPGDSSGGARWSTSVAAVARLPRA